MSNYKVSVIIPCYNNGLYVEKAILSIVNQTLEDIECIVINNGSTDNSWEVITKLMKQYPNKVFGFSKEHGIVSTGRNLGLSKIRGKYFGFLDADDYCENTMFEKLYTKAEETNSDVVYSDWYITYDDKEIKAHEDIYNDEKGFMVHMYSGLWNKLYKTESFINNNINFEMSHNEDVVFLFKNAHFLKRFSKVDEAFVHYVQRQGSLIHVYDDKVKQMVFNWQEIYRYYKENKLFDKYHDELEYASIKYMLGQPLKRACMIPNKKERNKTCDLFWNNLNDNFPNWHNNKYLKEFKDLKHTYFKLMNRITYPIFRFLLSL